MRWLALAVFFVLAACTPRLESTPAPPPVPLTVPTVVCSKAALIDGTQQLVFTSGRRVCVQG